MPLNWSQEKYVKALKFATEAHCAVSQKVPGTEFPYICHPVMVTMEVLAALSHHENVNGDLAVCCALLHDVIEDTKASYEDVKDAFGKDIADGVSALSKREDAAASAKDEVSRKKLMMADSLARIKSQPKEVWMVKLSDRITNLMAPPAYWSSEKRRKYREEASTILAALGEASDFLARRLKQRIEKYGQYISE